MPSTCLRSQFYLYVSATYHLTRTSYDIATSDAPVDIGVGDRGAGGAAALPTLEKFAKINHNPAENRPKIGRNFSKQWIFYRAASLNFISPYAHAWTFSPKAKLLEGDKTRQVIICGC